MDELAEKFWADGMNDFIHARIDEASAGGSAPGAPEYAEDARERKAQSGARLYLDNLEGAPMTYTYACKACGLDPAADVRFLGKRVHALAKAMAAQNVDAADAPVSPPLGPTGSVARGGSASNPMPTRRRRRRKRCSGRRACRRKSVRRADGHGCGGSRGTSGRWRGRQDARAFEGDANATFRRPRGLRGW